MLDSEKNSISDEDIENYRSSDKDPLIAAFANEVHRLRQGIRKHQSQTGHSLCWLNDVALWQLIDENAEYPHDTLPVRDEFLTNCRRYYQSRLDGTPWVEPKVVRKITDEK